MFTLKHNFIHSIFYRDSALFVIMYSDCVVYNIFSCVLVCRNAAEKFPTLQAELLESMEPPRKIVKERFKRLHKNGEPFKVFNFCENCHLACDSNDVIIMCSIQYFSYLIK